MEVNALDYKEAVLLTNANAKLVLMEGIVK